MVWKARETVRGFGSSLLGAMAVSTILTATVALPLGLDAAGDHRPDGLADAIALDDVRFPAAVSLDAGAIETLASDDLADQPLAGEAEVAGVFVTPTAAPVDGGADDIEPTDTGDTGDDTEAFAPAIPSPTPVADAPAPTPPPAQPTAAPRDPQGEPDVQSQTPGPATPQPIEQADPHTDQPPATPTEAPEATTPPDTDQPTPDPAGPSTDLYAFVSGSPLRQDQVGSLDLKTVNGGATETTGVTVSVSAAGASILSVSPGRADWTCTGTDAAWQCNGPTLEAVSWSRGVMTVLPHDEDLTVSVSVDHALVDEEPDNNSFSTTVPVVPNPTIPGQPDDPTATELTPTPVPTADPPLEPQPTASAQPTQPAEPTPTSPPTVVPTTTPTPSATPADPDQPGGDGTSGTGPTPSPTPTTEADTTDTGATGGGGVGQATEVVVTQQQPAVEPDDPPVVPTEPTP